MTGKAQWLPTASVRRSRRALVPPPRRRWRFVALLSTALLACSGGESAAPTSTAVARRAHSPVLASAASAPKEWPSAVAPGGLTVSHPPASVTTIDAANSTLVISSAGTSPLAGDNDKETGAISVTTRPNPNRLSITEFFDGRNDSLLDGPSEPVLVGSRLGYLFRPTQSLSYDVVVVVPAEDAFVVILDFGAGFQSGDDFRKMLASIRLPN